MLSSPLCHEAGNPYPQGSGEHEHQDAEGERGGASAHILLVAAANDDAREGGRQGTGKHHHLQLRGVHLEDETYDEQHGRHEEELEAGVVDDLLVELELQPREGEARGKHGDTRVGLGDELKVGVEDRGELDAAQYQDNGQDGSPADGGLEGFEHRVALLGTVLHLARGAGARIEQGHADGDAHGIDHDGDDSHDEARGGGAAIDGLEHGKAEEADGGRTGDEGAHGSLATGVLKNLVRGEVRQEKQAHEHDEADDEQLGVVEEHGAVGLDDGDKQGRRQGIGEHELIEDLRIGSGEHTALARGVPQRHDDEDGEDVFDEDGEHKLSYFLG